MESKTIRVRYFSLSIVLSDRSGCVAFLCVIARLAGRSTVIYKDLFLILGQHADRLQLEFRPKQLTSDFEPALIKAVADEVCLHTSFIEHFQ
jgi:hypothetical protein